MKAPRLACRAALRRELLTRWSSLWLLGLLGALCGMARPVAPAAAKPAGGQVSPAVSGAYATLLYGDSFLLGVRVLGQSLRESGTEHDLVCLATQGTSAAALATLRADGWRVHVVAPVANPATGPTAHFRRGYPARFWAVYTKLLVYNLTAYETVIYLDADTLVVRNIDDAFNCGRFCANLKHSDRLNSGVLVLRPSVVTLSALLAAAVATPSYTGGDQGFLNAYYDGFGSAPLFDPSSPRAALALPLQRLPAGYNADVGLFALNGNKWMIAADAVRVMHFTLGPIKPWVWWAPWLLECAATWQQVRGRLPIHPGLPETQAWGSSAVTQLLLAALPLLLAGAASLEREPGVGRGRGLSRSVLMRALQWPLAAMRLPSAPSPAALQMLLAVRGTGVLGGWAALLAGLTVAGLVVPAVVRPSWGWLLTYEWAGVTAALLISRILHRCYRQGLMAAGWKAPRGSAVPAASDELLAATLAIAGPAVCACAALPWLAVPLGARALIPKILVTAGLGAGLAAYLSYALGEAAMLWAMAGYHTGVQRSSATRV